MAEEEKPRIVIYGGPGCEGCDELKAELDRRGVHYEYKDVVKDNVTPPGQEGVEILTVPVVEVCTVKREGFTVQDPDFLEAYSKMSCREVDAFEEVRRKAGDEATHELVKRILGKKEEEE